MYKTARRMHISPYARLWLTLGWVLLLGITGRAWNTSLAVGSIVTRIQCPAGYQATLYAQGLVSPDGLAFDSDGALYVAEEIAGRVSRIAPDGNAVPVLTALQSPEGIAFDPDGNLYVVEDGQNGRLIRRAPDGTQTTLASGLTAPEGVVWTTGGTLYMTESNIEFVQSDPFALETRIIAVTGVNQTTPLRTDPLGGSYAGITSGADGKLYVTNEIAGNQVPGTSIIITDSIFRVDPVTKERTLFASGLTSPEGLRFGADGAFPLYVAEEGAGRLSQVAANGSRTALCTGFESIEDVIVDGDGRLYVSEDGSGAIILITPPTLAPTATPTPTATATAGPGGTTGDGIIFLPLLLGAN